MLILVSLDASRVEPPLGVRPQIAHFGKRQLNAHMASSIQMVGRSWLAITL